jgi:quercetin dioxygenase-like cupin family protein
MKIIHYQDVEPRHFDSEAAKAISGRVLIGKADGADHFCMRLFEFSPGGFSPKHAHPWEHEIFFHAGQGEVFFQGAWTPVKAGCAVFVPPGAEHQVRNTGQERLTMLCLIPPEAPEL